MAEWWQEILVGGIARFEVESLFKRKQNKRALEIAETQLRLTAKVVSRLEDIQNILTVTHLTNLTKSPMLKGCDISKWQGEVDFDRLKEDVDFVIMRSSLGTGLSDSQFARNQSEVRRLGIPHGYYHFAYPEVNEPEVEAEWFLASIGEVQDGEFLALDLEGEIGSDPVSWAHRFMKHLQDRLGGYKPLIYTSHALLGQHDWSQVVAEDYGLWVASWGLNTGELDMSRQPDSRQWPFWAFWQFTSKGILGGIHPIDINLFAGDLDTLSRYGFHTNKPSAPNPDPQPVDLTPLEEIPVEIVPTPVDPVIINKPTLNEPVTTMTTKGIRTSEFWSHLAVVVGGIGTTVTALFDKGFLTDHPVLAAGVAGVGIFSAAIATLAYNISRGLAKQNPPTA